METILKRTSFKGFGLQKEGNGFYFCTEINYIKQAAIVLYDLKSKKQYKRIELTKDLFYGNVLCVIISDLRIAEFGYLLSADGKEFKDKFCRMLDGEKKLCRFLFPIEDKKFKTDEFPGIPFDESYFYLANIKGYTMLSKNIVNPGTFKSFEKKLTGIKELGMTSIIFMPVYEVCEPENAVYDYRKTPGNIKSNYWGFGEGFHYALKNELGVERADAEFKKMVLKMHSLNLECILMMEFRNSNKEYLLDVLKYYVSEYHIDGFRLIGDNLPIEAVIKDPFLSNTKILTNYRNAKEFSFSLSPAKKNLCIIDEQFMNQVRRFVKGDEDLVPYISFSIRENSKYYSLVHFPTDFSGFSLNDLVSYNLKHNEANDEENRDGTDYNYSWNCGEEGPSKKKSVLALRKRMVRNLYISSFLTQGIPMIVAGDENLNSQSGNNNPYCQDNEIGWINFRKDKAAIDFYKFTKNLLAFRKRHSILHQPKELMLFDYMSCKVPDISFHGAEAFRMDQNPVSREFGVLYYGDYSKQYTGKKEESVFVVYNMNWEKREFALPLFGKGYKWKLLYSTDGSTDENFDEENAKEYKESVYLAEGRTISIFLLS